MARILQSVTQFLQRQRDWWPIALFSVHLIHSLAFASLYPHVVYDPDLLAYFVYFRSWLEQSTALHGAQYFTVPKPLLVFFLGPLSDVSWAFYFSAVASATLGSVVYLVGRAAFGRMAGILLSVLLLLDVEKGILTLRSSADLYLAFFLFLTVHFSTRRRLPLASACLLFSALVKPVTLPCALHFLVLDEPSRWKKWICAFVPFCALPIILLSNYLLVGTALGPGQFFAEFDALGEGTAIGPGEVFHFVVWTQLVKHAFVSTALWGFLGLALWLARDKRRLTMPLFLVPLLFLGGYLTLSVATPYVPFFRFFWVVQIWFAGFIVFGMLVAARRVARGQRWLKVAATCVMLFFLTDDYVGRQLSYRHRFAVPFENAMAFVSTTPETLERERREGETILTPLAFMPYLMWKVDVHDRGDVVFAAEQLATEAESARPDWILYVPEIFASRSGLDLMNRLVTEGGYEVRSTSGTAALLRNTTTS